MWAFLVLNGINKKVLKENSTSNWLLSYDSVKSPMGGLNGLPQPTKFCIEQKEGGRKMLQHKTTAHALGSNPCSEKATDKQKNSQEGFVF